MLMKSTRAISLRVVHNAFDIPYPTLSYPILHEAPFFRFLQMIRHRVSHPPTLHTRNYE